MIGDIQFVIRYNGGEGHQWVQEVDDGGVQMTRIISMAEHFDSEKDAKNAMTLLTIGYGVGDLQLSSVSYEQ